ncbi:VCBS repeat-containing protein [Thalassococcus sp. BH17M4-6]|uniref:VCBS repeat-containing protein n=1 Tax=Thalassococcus sp. BH17M4-6 TaxID=3413148 RepID=UPI003BDF2B66
MRSAAPRLPWRRWRGIARGAFCAMGLWLGSSCGTGSAIAQTAPQVVGAEYAAPTDRYDHGVLGDAIEWGALVLRLRDCPTCAPRGVRLTLPQTRVFEDLAPRLIRTDSGQTIAMVVESDLRRGARLALYGAEGLVTATPYIGRRNRWLAPVGAADLDGDGRVEIAYVDRPHLAKTLRVWRLEGERLSPVADLAGLTNHSIGWDYILGGLRECGTGPEMILADADWTRVMAVRLSAGQLTVTPLAPYRGRADIDRALACG